MLGNSFQRVGVEVLRGMLGAIAACALVLTPQPGLAQFTPRDGQIIARALSFDEAIRSGTVEIGVVFAPERPISVQQAQTVHAVIGDALVAGRITLKSRLIPADQLSKVTGIGGIYITGDLGPQLDDAVAAAKRLHVATISNDMACVRTGPCVLAFSSEPTVEIVLNRASAIGAGVQFTEAFRMLVREV